MKATLSFRKDLAEKVFHNVLQLMPVILSVMKMKKKMLVMSILISHIFFNASFSQDIPVFLSRYDSCHVRVPDQPHVAIEALIAGSPMVRVAYVIPSNRTAQPNGVAYLQNAIRIGQQYYKEQMEQNGFGAKTYTFETEADGVTPLVHVVQVDETDDFLRGDIWGRTIQAVSNVGISVWASGQVWVLVPEAHLMLADGTVTGGTALGASFGTGDSPGVAMIGSNALPLFQPGLLTDDTPYDGKVLPALGPFPMKQDLTFAWFEGSTFSSIASSWQGALLHEMGHAFGLAHDYRNDNNFHGNLMFNGLRGIRGSLFPEKYPQDYTRLEYSSALILDVNHYFNSGKRVNSSPVISFANPGSVIPQQGLVRIAFKASDDDSLSLAHLRYGGDAVAEIVLKGTEADTAFAVPYFAQGYSNSYTIAVHDKQGNTTFSNLEFNVPAGDNHGPFPFIRIDPPVPGLNQAVTLNASQSYDLDNDQSSLLASWDVDNDGEFDTEPSTNKTVQYLYKYGGNYLIRLKLTDPAGAQVVSTPVSIKIPGEKKIAVESLTLIDAVKDEDVADLKDGMAIKLSAWEGKTFSIRANISPGEIDRVEFNLKGPVTHQQIEKIPPYSLFGDNPQGNFTGRKLLPGEYTITVTPFSPSEKGIALSLSFRVIDSNAPGQPTWDKTIGAMLDDYLFSTIATADGGYLLAGHSNSNSSGDKSENSKGSGDYWIVKIDAQHNKEWDKTFGGDNSDELHSAIATPDGGFLLAGLSQSDASGDKSENRKGFYDYWVVKTDSKGNKLWDKTYGGNRADVPYSVVAMPKGGYLLAGGSESNATGDKSEDTRGSLDYWIIRIDEQGNKIWDKTFGGSRVEEFRIATADSDGSCLLGGSSRSSISGDKSENSKGSLDYWVVKIDKNGNKIWDKTIGGNGDDLLYSINVATDGGYLLAGYSDSNATGDKSVNSKGYDYWVVKIDNQGKKVWDKTIGGDGSDVLFTAISTRDRGFLLAGFSDSKVSADKSEDGNGTNDYWVIKIDSQGNKLWDKTVGGSGYDFLRTAILTSDGNYLLGGYSNSNASGDKTENRKGVCNPNEFCSYDYWIIEIKEASAAAVTSLTLMNANTDQEIQELKDGDVVRLTEVGNGLLNIRANITDENIKKVAFHLKGPLNHHQTERISPYELFGDQGGKLPAGEYTLTVTSYANTNKGADLTISFTVTDGFSISGFTLIDATLDRQVGKLSEGDIIDLSLLKGHKISVLVDTQPIHIEKVDLVLQGPIVHSTTERYFPYTLFGDLTKEGCATDYEGLKLVPGTYTLTATPYASGVKGTPYAITFAVINGGSADDGCRKVEVFPLPASGVINIIHEGETENTHMFLLDFNGNVLLRQPLSQQPAEQLDVSVYRKGIHYLKIVSPEGLQIIRLVIE